MIILSATSVTVCVLGFMMESTSWGGADARTIQFVVPPVSHVMCESAHITISIGSVR